MRIYFNITTVLVLFIVSTTALAEMLSCPPVDSFIKKPGKYGWSWDISYKTPFPYFLENGGAGIFSPADTPFLSSSTLAVSIVDIKPSSKNDDGTGLTKLSLLCSYYLDSQAALNNDRPDVEINFENLNISPDILKQLMTTALWVKDRWERGYVIRGEGYLCMTTAGHPEKCSITVTR
jgi:hypothetical protein